MINKVILALAIFFISIGTQNNSKTTNDMSAPVYTYFTHATWNVKPGMQQQFIAAWDEMLNIFSRLPHGPVEKSILIQNTKDSTVFYSFGPWEKMEHIEAMQQQPAAQQALKRVKEFCTEMKPEVNKVIRDVKLEQH